MGNSASNQEETFKKCRVSGWSAPEDGGQLRGLAGAMTKKHAKCANDKNVVCVNTKADGGTLEKGMPLVCLQEGGSTNQGHLVAIYPGWSRVAESSSSKTTRFLKLTPYLDWINARLKL